MQFKRRLILVGLALSPLGLASPCAQAQGVDVTAHVQVHPRASAKNKASLSSADVVVWLAPVQPEGRPPATGHPGPYRLVQKDKMFTPHLQVVPTGTSVDFPNQDPFFHNVFSLFNGRRFDLGLYESGSTRAVRFDREGVSYIFCNIHPEMGAIVLALSTPYYAVSTADGSIVIHGVPAGSYRMHVWSEVAQPTNPMDAERMVQVPATPVRLKDIDLQGLADPMEHHMNKFGEEYSPPRKLPY